MIKIDHTRFERNKPFKQDRFFILPTITVYHRTNIKLRWLSIRFEWFRFYFGYGIYYFKSASKMAVISPPNDV